MEGRRILFSEELYQLAMILHTLPPHQPPIIFPVVRSPRLSHRLSQGRTYPKGDVHHHLKMRGWSLE